MLWQADKKGYMYKSLFLLIFLVGCATAGNKIGMDKISQIKEGVTTKQEIVGLFGNPNADTLNGDGKEILMYVYGKYRAKPSTYIPIIGLMAGGGNMEQQALQILIDKNGKVEKFIQTNGNTQINLGL
jgi:outer membrane protein assembly factor BamE (lipoprotein component of BamABCDE complex)